MDMQMAYVVPAAGQGRRLGAGKNKLLVDVGGRPLLALTLSALAAAAADLPLLETIVVAAPVEIDFVTEHVLPAVSGSDALGRVRVVAGGRTRQESVACGLAALNAAVEWVIIHDGARPLVSRELVGRVVAAARSHGAAIPVLPPADTVKQVDNEDLVTATLPRVNLRLAQTPQVFRQSIIAQAYKQAAADGAVGTDDAALVERLGLPVAVAAGDPHNLKVTGPEDLDRLPGYRATAADVPAPTAAIPAPAAAGVLRVGFGYDVHRVSDDPGRPLLLGGVRIAFDAGLAGHSDADVLTHAIIDALLGAAALGDIGTHFPDTDPDYAGADSIDLLRRVVGLLAARGARPVNIDATVVAERPRLAPHIPAMRARLAAAMNVAVTAVSVKATTSEGLGFVGDGSGLAAYAVCNLAVDA